MASDLPSFVLDCLFDSFCEETVSDDDDVRNYDNIGNLAMKLTMTAGIILIDTQTPVMIKSYSMKLSDHNRSGL